MFVRTFLPEAEKFFPKLRVEGVGRLAFELDNHCCCRLYDALAAWVHNHNKHKHGCIQGDSLELGRCRLLVKDLSWISVSSGDRCPL